MEDNNLQFPEIVYYINLKHRNDRREKIINELNCMNFKNVVRIDAVLDNEGWMGCTKSHIIALENFCNSNYNNCIIFEDDFHFNNYENATLMLEKFKNTMIDWNVVFLSCNYRIKNKHKTNYNFLAKIISNKRVWAKTTAGYMVNKKFANILLQNFKECVEKRCIIDEYWKLLQIDEKYVWYSFHPKLGTQSPDYSDIRKECVNYVDALT